MNVSLRRCFPNRRNGPRTYRQPEIQIHQQGKTVARIDVGNQPAVSTAIHKRSRRAKGRRNNN